MSNTTLSPNMNLVVPTVGVDPGPDWANNVNADLSILDGHNHAPGSGVQITPAGLNINSDLSFIVHNAINLRSARFTPQNPAISGALDLGCVYVSGADLYYNDTAGNQVKITSGGNVNATASGISSGTATASFVASVLVVNAASNTPANIQVASVLLGNNSAGTNYLTLAPPASLASNFSLVLPVIPAANSFLQIDTSGNITGSIAVSQGIQQSMLALRTTGTTVAAGGVAVSTSSAGFTFGASNTPTQVTNLSVTITTTGRPVSLSLQADGAGTNDSFVGVNGNGGMDGYFYRGATQLSKDFISTFNSPISGTFQAYVPPGSFKFLDQPAAGTYTYHFFVSSTSTAIVNYCVLVAYEI